MLDIESAPNMAFVWGLFKQNISISQIVDSGYVLCWAAKWYGDSEVHFDSVYQSRPKAMLKRIHKMLDEADAVVHYNGLRFDIPTLNKEFILNGLTPPAPYRQIDLFQTARTRFRFTSNKLDYIADALGVGNKHRHEGFELWVKCMNNDPDAWKTMEEYNKQDVQLLEGVYEIFRPWIKNHPNTGIYNDDDIRQCPVCSGVRLHRRGFTFTAGVRYQRYRCADCGHWSRDRINSLQRPELVSDKT